MARFIPPQLDETLLALCAALRTLMDAKGMTQREWAEKARCRRGV